MEQNCLAGTQKSGLRSRTLYRVAAVGIATLITQASPGGAASSWGVECLTTDLANNSYCVTSLNDDIPSDSAAWTLRKSVEDANTRAAASATIGFQDVLFSAATSSDNAKLVLNSTLEIKTNITITAPTDSGGSPLLTIVRGDSVASGAPLIAINPTADAHPATLTTGPAANQATEEVRIENVNIQARANTENPQGSGFAGQTQEFANPGVAIQVKETISVTSTGPDVVAPTVVLVNTTISNSVSESGGAAINTPGNVRVEGSTLVGNVAITPSGGAPTDGGAIKAEGTVTVVSSALNNNSATGNGGAISASSVNVSNAENSSNSQLIGNTAGGSGGAINSSGNTVISGAALAGNTAGGIKSAVDPVAPPTATPTGGDGGAVNAGSTVQISESQLTGNQALKGADSNSTTGNGGAISAGDQVTVSASTLNSNTAALGNGGAISATGESSTVAVTNSGLGSNAAGRDGGAISASGTTGAVSVANSSLGLNTAGGNGGAIAAGGAVTVGSGSVLASNSSTSGNGGAITAGGDVTVVNSGLVSNTASGNGGAISATGVTSAVDVTNSGLAENTSGGSGGAVSVTGATSSVEVTNSVLALNTATTGDGGAIAASGANSSVSIISTGLGYNSAGGDGGAIAASGATSVVQITDSSIAENRAGKDGGGISSVGQVNVGSNAATPINAPTTGNVESALTSIKTTTQNDSTFSASTSISLTLGSNVYSTSAGQGSSGSSDSATNPSGSIMFKNIAASGNGGAISAQGEVTVTSGSNIYANTANQDGGAISSQSTVEISNSAVSGNTATTGNGGAISTGGQVSASASTLNGNEAQEGYGGAIYAGAAINLSDTEFFSNTAFESGGAIYAEGNVAVIDSVFGINIESDVEAQEEPETQSNIAYLGQGGAIYSEGKVTTTRSAFVQNFSGSGGGAIAAEQTVSMNSSIFVGNGSFGDGGAVYATGGVIVENGSVLLANTAGVNPESEFGFGFFYPIFLDGLVFFELDISGGNGGAIYSEGDVRVSGSNIGAAPPGVGAEFSSVFANKALCAAFWDDGDESGWGQECDWDEVYYEDDFDYFEEVSVGNGGGIYALGKVTIEGGNTTINIDLDALSLLDTFIAKEVSFEQSYLTNNYAQNNGGAVYALGGLSVSDAIFGATPEINPNYNPERRYLNPDYVPGRTEPNPLFGNGELPRVPNILFDPEVPSVIPNSMCAGANQFYGNENTGESWCVIDGIWYTTTIQNPDPASIPDFPNDLYSNEPFLYYEAIGDEFLYLLDDESKAENNHKFIYRGNESGSDGGAIYVEGITTINNSSFEGNTSDNDGGAIYSEGTLEVKDSGFNRNWAEDDGGAIRTTPGTGDLFITRTSFTENVSMDDGGAIYISTGSVEHYDDVILSSLFRGNEAFGTGGAVDSGYVVLILNTFEDNKSLEGQSLNVSGGYLSGNVLIGPAGGQDLCFAAGDLIANYNYGTDESCFVSNNYLLTRVEITEEGALHTLPAGYESTLLGELKDNEEFFLEVPSENNLDGVLAPLGTFVTNELNTDFKSEIRDSTVSWTAGHLQGIFPVIPNEPEDDNSEGDSEIVQPKDQEQNSGSNNQGVVSQPDSTNPNSPVLIFEPTLSAEELARISQLRAEQLAAELLRQKEEERIAAEDLAKKKAAKSARDKARALAAEKRRAQLAALKAKIAATHARGVALKQKPSWINLMKNSSSSNSAKGLVRVPIK